MSKKHNPGLILGDDQVKRCWWCGGDPQYIEYHDLEWGRKETDNNRLFEKICLEGFQAGLSWITILKKRENFRKAYADFAIEKVARFNQRTVERLVNNVGIIRHRGKIESSINNAKRALDLLTEFDSLTDYFDQFRPQNHSVPRTREDVPSITDESTRMSKDLKKRGWSFVGPTTCYAFMQAMGLVNDHLLGCHVRSECEP